MYDYLRSLKKTSYEDIITKKFTYFVERRMFFYEICERI